MTELRDGYKDTEIGVIPAEWDVVKVGGILNVQTGKMNAQDQIEDGKYPFFTRSIDVQTIDTYAYDTEALFIAGEGNFKVKYYNGKFNCHQRTYMLTSIEDNNMKFLLNAIQPKVNKLISTSVGSTVQSLRKPIIEALKIPLPPLKEQEKIADILSTADDKIDAIASQIQKAQTLKKGLLQKLLSEGIGHSEFKDSELGKIPESWEITTVGKSSKNFDVQRVPLKSEYRQSIQGEYPYYGAQGIIDYVNDYIFDGRYLLVAEDGENVKGQKYNIAFVVSGKFWVNNHAHILQANDNMDLYFISSILNHINIIKYVTGTGQPKLNKAQLNSIKIPLPPLKEQKQIAEILSTTDEKLEVLVSKKEKYETLKKGLLQKLLSGEIRTV